MTTAITKKLKPDENEGIVAIIRSRFLALPLPKQTEIKIQGIIGILVVLHTCAIWSLKLWEAHGLRVFQNSVLSISGLKRQKIMEEWRKLHNELHGLYLSPW
jgi:hypothetical protein